MSIPFPRDAARRAFSEWADLVKEESRRGGTKLPGLYMTATETAKLSLKKTENGGCVFSFPMGFVRSNGGKDVAQVVEVRVHEENGKLEAAGVSRVKP